MTEPLLHVSAIDVFYGPIQALRSVDVRVGASEMVALVGANGAGKTTTLRTISGMIHPRSGSVLLQGEDISALPAHEIVRRGLVHLPEGRELFPGMSVEDNLRAGFWVKGKSEKRFAVAREKVMDLFPILSERSKQAAGTLSGGEQQMLGVARALMSEPRVLLVDELSLGLAPKVVAHLFQILRQVNGEGTAVVIVEQFVHMALANTHRAYVLAKGAVALEGRSSELLTDPRLVSTYLGGQAAQTRSPRAAASGRGTSKRSTRKR